MTTQPMTKPAIATNSGSPSVVVSLSLDSAEALMALVKRDALILQESGEPVPAYAVEAIGALQAAITAGWERVIDEAMGCFDETSEPATPTEAVLLAGADGVNGVLLPGAVEEWAAAAQAIKTLGEHGVSIDTGDTSLVAKVSRPRWMVFHTCGNAAHDFHPQIAAEGRDTAGAVLFTRVEFTRA